jgi:hypothetical protein
MKEDQKAQAELRERSGSSRRAEGEQSGVRLIRKGGRTVSISFDTYLGRRSPVWCWDDDHLGWLALGRLPFQGCQLEHINVEFPSFGSARSSFNVI